VVAHRKPPGQRIDNRPSRQRGPAPEVREALGNCPDDDPGVVAAWRQIAASAPPGVLTSADAMAVELAAKLWCEFQRDPVKFQPSKLTALSRLLGTFGMTPAGRLALSLPLAKDKRENPFSAFDSPFASIRR